MDLEKIKKAFEEIKSQEGLEYVEINVRDPQQEIHLEWAKQNREEL